MQHEASAYRFVGTKLTPVISDPDIQSIEDASSEQDRFKPASSHLATALRHFSDRDSPDYRNSIKESISAVEAACQIITGDPKATLRTAVKKLEDCSVKLRSVFRGALEKMYGVMRREYSTLY
jgi:hypothetical protein